MRIIHPTTSVLAAVATTMIALLQAHSGWHAQPAPWPARPIRLIVPGGAGGVIDQRARWLAEHLAPRLGQPVIVVDVPGAGGDLGTAQAARAPADGHTLVIVHQGTLAINPHLVDHPGYDPLHDFAPITRVGVGPLLLCVNAALPVTSVGELVALARGWPGELTFASPGIGTPPHLAGELFKRKAGIDITHVPYRGGAQAVSALIAGEVAMSIEGLSVQLPYVRSGRLRALAVTGPHRLAMLPDVPTLAEAGVAGYEFVGWVGVAAPASTPGPIVQRLHREIAAVIGSEEGRAWLAAYGLEPGGEPPAVFARLVRDEHARWGALIRESRIKGE